MASRILHLLDSTTPGDSVDMIAGLIAGQASTTHRIAVLGHRSTANLAALAGIPAGALSFVPSAGWADPAGWRGTRKLIRQFEPTHVHAWGVPAAVALAAGGRRFAGRRLGTFTDIPSLGHMRILRLVERRTQQNPFHWTAASPFIRRRLADQGIGRLTITPPGIPLNPAWPPSEVAVLKQKLGLSPGDGPVLLLGGEGPAARYDLGIWTAAIMVHLFPGLKAVVREDSRNRINLSLDRFFHTLADESMLVVAEPEVPWRSLVQVADILLVTAVGSIPAASVFAAMAAGVPIVSTPNASLAAVLQPNQTALVASSAQPRAICAQLELFMTDPTRGAVLAQNARAQVQADFGVPAMLDTFAALYQTAPAAAMAV